MKVLETRRELAGALETVRGAGERLVLVPTMGYLHEGHLALVDHARERGDRVALSIFVNPTQFGPDEDFGRYPRDLDRDLDQAEARGVDLVFAPSASEVYPDGEPRVTVDPGSLANRLCGAHRPGHFRGVLTVVAKLLGLFRPDTAVFGRKDLQQGVLIRRMVEDLEMGTEITLAPLVREADGLAMSSRNAFLAEMERGEALGLFRGLDAARDAFRAGERSTERLLEAARERMAEHRGLEVQYLEVAASRDLAPVHDQAPEDAVLLGAGLVGRNRLIDNVVLGDAADLPGDRRVGEATISLAEAAEEPGEPGREPPAPVIRKAAEGGLPKWARASPERRDHMERVAVLMGEWAQGRGKDETERARWKALGHLHDALRDESPSVLRQVVPRRFRKFPAPLLHGPAVAELLREEGVTDEPFLRALAYHTTGHPELDEAGRALYAADYLEPGRPYLPTWLEGLRDRMPDELDGVVREVARARMAHQLVRGRVLRDETTAFWNRLIQERNG